MRVSDIFGVRLKRVERENQLLKEDVKALKIDSDKLERRMRALELRTQKPSHC